MGRDGTWKHVLCGRGCLIIILDRVDSDGIRRQETENDDNQSECWLSKLKLGKCELCTNELVMQANFDK